MTEKGENNYIKDCQKREGIIGEVLRFAFTDKQTQCNFENIKEFYFKNFTVYLNLRKYINICSAPYSYGDFWFIDAGFQFIWKNHCGIIKPECLTWPEVKRRCMVILKNSDLFRPAEKCIANNEDIKIL